MLSQQTHWISVQASVQREQAKINKIEITVKLNQINQLIQNKCKFQKLKTSTKSAKHKNHFINNGKLRRVAEINHQGPFINNQSVNTKSNTGIHLAH